jgi:hypothetical protein
MIYSNNKKLFRHERFTPTLTWIYSNINIVYFNINMDLPQD